MTRLEPEQPFLLRWSISARINGPRRGLANASRVPLPGIGDSGSVASFRVALEVTKWKTKTRTKHSIGS